MRRLGEVKIHVGAIKNERLSVAGQKSMHDVIDTNENKIGRQFNQETVRRVDK